MFPHFRIARFCVPLIATVSALGCSSGLSPFGCLPNATQLCLGESGCSGVQTCLADGMSLSVCRCTGDVADTGVRETGTFDGGTHPSAGGPRILSFTSTIAMMAPNDTAQFTVIATHPDGVDNVIGGQLQDRDGRTYGVLATSAAEGAYGFNLSFRQLNGIAAISDQTASARPFREFRARIFDAAGNEAFSDFIRITFTCGIDQAPDGEHPAGESWLCRGACVDILSSRSNCGACGVTVPRESECRNGQVSCTYEYQSCGGACVFYNDLRNCGTCGRNCGAFGQTATCEQSGRDMFCELVSQTPVSLSCDHVCESVGATCYTAESGDSRTAGPANCVRVYTSNQPFRECTCHSASSRLP